MSISKQQVADSLCHLPSPDNLKIDPRPLQHSFEADSRIFEEYSFWLLKIGRGLNVTSQPTPAKQDSPIIMAILATVLADN